MHVLSKEAQNSASVAAILKQVLNGQAAKRDVIPSKRFCLVLEVIQSYRFEPERENKEVNDQLEGTFWCTCERCEAMPT